MRALIVALMLTFAPSAYAQEPVARWADWASYGTAVVNPAISAVQAARSDRPLCKLGQLALSELVGNGATLTIKHFVRSARPCVGCAPDGMPSGHTMNSTLGFTGWRYGMVFSFATGQLRQDAHRHTLPQVLAGLGIGIGAEFAGRLVKCGPQ